MFMFPSQEVVSNLRKEYPEGTRTELMRMDNCQAFPIGTQGIVISVDDVASIRWDNGSHLNLVDGVDICKKI